MDFNRKLIEFVRFHKSIYDPNDPNYGDAARKRETWKEISSKLEVTEKECKKSWILLREGYRRILKKKIASESDPISRRDKDTRKWTYEDDLSFLSTHMKYRSYAEINSKTNNTLVEENLAELDNEASTPATTSDVSAHKRATLKRSRTHGAVGRRSCTHEPTSTNLVKYVLDKTTNRSDIQQFFDSMAATVQTFSPRDRTIAKKKVFEVISQMELELTERRPASSFQNKRPSESDTEVTESRGGLYPTPSPEGLPAGLSECDSDDDSDAELVLNIKVEPEQHLGLNIKQEQFT